MNEMKKRRSVSRAVVARLTLIVLLLAIVGGALTSCFGGPAPAQLKKAYEITVDPANGNGLSAGELNKLADDIIASKNAFRIREQLVASLNGYDMNAEDFDDSKIPLPTNKDVTTGDETTTEAPETTTAPETEAKPAAETGAGSDTAAPETTAAPVDVSPNEAHPENAAVYALTALKKGGIDITAYEHHMTRADVESLVNCFKVEAKTDAKLGFFANILHFIALGFEWMINVLGFGNFVLGTFFFAIVVEILLLPVGIHQQNVSRKQARLRPKEMAIRNKYKGRTDPVTQQKMSREIQELYMNGGYSPMAGCWPMLLTMPFMLALYYIVIDPLKYMMACPADVSNALILFAGTSRAAGGLGLQLGSGMSRGTIEVLSMIRDGGYELSGITNFAFLTNGGAVYEELAGIIPRIPNFTLFGMNMGLTPGFRQPYGLLVIPVLTFVLYFFSMKITRKLTFQPMATGDGKDPAQGCSNTMMDLLMPAMSTYFAFIVPAAVGIYWMFKSIVGTAKQFILYKAMPMPKFTEEDYKAAERELAGKERHKPVKHSGTRNPNVRSLHHIDDEDYEPKPVEDPKKKKQIAAPAEPAEKPAEKTSGKTAEPQKNGVVNCAPLKDDVRDREEEKKHGLFGRKKDQSAKKDKKDKKDE